MLKDVRRKSTSFGLSLAFALTALVLAAPSTEAGNKYFTVSGRVLKIDSKQRTLLIADRKAEYPYLITVPESVTLKITWGRYMRMTEPRFEDVFASDRVQVKCFRPESEQLTKLADGTRAIVAIASR